MARLAVLLAIIILGYLLWQELKKCNPKRRRQLLLRGGVIGLVAVVLILALTGRVHWLMAAAAAMIPLAKILFGLLLRSFPFLQVWLKHREGSHSGQATPPNTTDLSEDEALQILGLKPGASHEEILLAHKKLIQKLHPDRGGNDYLAAKLNAARDILVRKQS
jgi:hypothetical protein